MNDKKWILPGLIIAVAIFTFPLWYNLGHKSPAPNIELAPEAKAAGQCILDKSQMRTRHMFLLDEWRDNVVRNGRRTYSTPDGRHFDMSLSNTCLKCHTNKEAFCDRCHNYASVRTYCWNCHINPAKGYKEIAGWKTTEEISLR